VGGFRATLAVLHGTLSLQRVILRGCGERDFGQPVLVRPGEPLVVEVPQA